MSTKSLIIDPPELTSFGDLAELRSTVWLDGQAKEIWFRTDLPLSDVNVGVEPFLSVCLLPAMRIGQNITTSAPVSPVFLANQQSIQKQFLIWDSDLKFIEIDAPQRSEAQAISGRRTATFFSGGVDSFYTALTHRDAIDDLVFVCGFDIPTQNSHLDQSVYTRLQHVANTLAKPLIRVETNLRDFSDSLAHWAFYQHGPAMGAVAQWLASRFKTFYIPGENFPDEPSAWLRGSQPLTDPLFSTELVTIVHDGFLPTRVKKIEAIIDSSCVQKSLRVCWKNRDNAYNCGQCSKCLRTMAAIRTCGCLDQCDTFPKELDLNALSRLPLALGEWRNLVEELLEKVSSDGKDPALAQSLQRCLIRHRRWGWIRTLTRHQRLDKLRTMLSRLSP